MNGHHHRLTLRSAILSIALPAMLAATMGASAQSTPNTPAPIGLAGAKPPVAAPVAPPAAPPSVSSQPADSEYSLWESVVRVDRFLDRDPKPSATDRKKYTECLRARDFKASALLERSPLTQDLANKCWITNQREEARRSQVKWACKDGTTAEIATRNENDDRLGYQMVINSPNAGGLSIRAESIRIAKSCEATGR